MARVTVENGKIYYKKFFKSCELNTDSLVWAYLQQEPVSARMCCGRMETEIGRVIVLTRDGQKEVFQFEGMEEPRELLAKIQAANPRIAVGYTKENRERFAGKQQKDLCR